MENKQLKPQEIKLLIALTEAQKSTIGFLRGFGKPTRKEQDENAFYNRLIEKLKYQYETRI